MRRFFVLCCVVLLCFGCYAQAEEAPNLLYNSNFEEEADGWPTGWAADMWQNDPGISYLELREDGQDGGLCVMIENAGSNDARFVQTVDVMPNTVYHLSGWVKAEGIDPASGGASLSVIGTYATFPEVHDTDGEWVYMECWVRTDANHTQLTLGPRLGDYSADNMGKAYFDNLSFSVATVIAPGTDIIPLKDYTNYQYQQSTASDIPAETKDSILPAVGLFALALLALWMLRRFSLPDGPVAITMVLLLAAALRLYLMATQPGYLTDMNCFYAWSKDMFAVGPNAFYETVSFCDYPPGYMYVLWITGALMKLFGIQGLDMAGRVVVKFMPMLADLGTIYLLWRLARKRLGEMPAVLLAALYAISPAILVDGAVWGQVDAFVALGLVATVALALKDNWRAALPVYIVAVLMKPQALMAAPIGVAALVMDIIPWKKDGKRIAINALSGLGIGLGVAAVMLVPFLWGKESPIAWIWNQYATTLGSYEYATLNTANLYYLIGANWTPLDAMLGPLSYGTWSTILMVVVILGTVVLYVWKRDKGMLPFYIALLFMGIYLFGPKMHERYLFPAFALLLYAYIRNKDVRLLAIFCGFSLTFYINCALVLRDLHLQTGFGLIGMILAAVNLILYGIGIWIALDPRPRELPVIHKQREPKDRVAEISGKTPPLPKLKGKDWASMLGLTLVYGLVAFIGLGSTVAPQTVWSSTGAQEQVVFDLGEAQEFTMLYYVGINGRDHTFEVEFSYDGEEWMDAVIAKAHAGDCFRWVFLGERTWNATEQKYDWDKEPMHCGARYVRFTMETPAVTLMEVGFHDMQGNLLPVASVTSTGAREENPGDPSLLADEQGVVPDAPSYLNGTYFDEIYHARTGYEHANGLSTYEWTHPPLGKVLIMLGIKLFGMTPFGWRFSGTLIGVLMVPAMYLLGKMLFKKTRYAFLAAFLMAFDMMHLTQTRIATIDSYAVFFIILMFGCMFRYMQMNFFRDGWRTLVPLGLSGLFMGLGCASKWTCMYAGVGLAVLFFWTVLRHVLQWRAAVAAGGEAAEKVKDFSKYLVGTLGACLVFFIAIPFAIYYFSYVPHFAWEGGLNWKRFWQVQGQIFDYHANLVDNHAFKSPWYEWPLMLKPMYYYDGKPYVGEGMVSTIMAMGNPAVWWVGFATFIYVAYKWLRPHLLGETVEDHRPAMLLLGFAAQFVPWMLVPRSMFIYHYFGSLPFVMLTIVYAFEQLYRHKPLRAQVVQMVYMGVVLALFVGFYPIATGVQVSRAWADAMNWLRFLYLPGWKYKGWLFY